MPDDKELNELPAIVKSESSIKDDAVLGMVDDLMEEANRENARRVKYYGQVKNLLDDNSRLILALTKIAEALNISIHQGDKKVNVKATDTPLSYDKVVFNQIAIHALSEVRSLVEISGANEALSKNRLKEIELLQEKVKTVVDSSNDRVEAVKTVLQDQINHLKEHSKDLLMQIQRRYSVESGERRLAVITQKGLRFVYLKEDEDEEQEPSLTKNINEALVFEDGSKAHNFRARIIKAIQREELKFPGGIERARKLSIVSLEVNFDD